MPFDDDARDTVPPSIDHLAAFDTFTARIRARLEVGRNVYGDRSFERPVTDLVEEVRQEVLDVAAWAFIAFERLRIIEAKAKRVDDDDANRERAQRGAW